MVAGNVARKLQAVETKEKDYTFLPEPLKHTSISLREVFSNMTRFEASAFSLVTKIEKQKITNCVYGYTNLWSEKGFVKDCFYGGRAKRDYVSKNTEGAIGFLGSSEMLELNPKPTKYLPSKRISTSQFSVSKGTVLISRSGTIGNVTFVSKTLSKLLVSEHAIRIVPNDYGGYIYAYLKTRTGKILVQANTFGAVVDQIEPEHLKNVIIPNAPEEIRSEIHKLVSESFELRDQSNELVDRAERVLYEELQLLPIEKLNLKYFDTTKELRNYSTKLSDLNFRLDSSYHLPVFQLILNTLSSKTKEIKYLRDKTVSKSIILPGRFKRTYVETEEHGIKFIGGKQINELNPASEKFLSEALHSSRLGKELLLKENCILITRSGTIGKASIVPKHWESWAANEHIIRVFPANNEIAGYIYCWLNSDYGMELIKKHTYGAVVDEIDINHVGDVPLPILNDQSKQKQINDLVLKANDLRYEAYLKEQSAISKMEAVINSKRQMKAVK